MLSATETLRVWLVQSGGGKNPATADGKKKERKQRDIIGSKASRGGRHTFSTVCVFSSCEVGGEEEREEEEEEEGVLPLQSGLSC